LVDVGRPVSLLRHNPNQQVEIEHLLTAGASQVSLMPFG